jgi:hypothetical protein
MPAALAGLVVFASMVGVELVRLTTLQRQLKATLLGTAVLAMGAVVVYPVLAFPTILGLAPFEFPMRLAGRHAGTNEVLALCLAAVVLPRLRRRELPGWAFAGFGLLVFGSFVSIFWAADQSQALWGTVRWLAVGIVALGGFQLLRDRPDASRRAADIIGITAIAVAGFALLQKQGIYWIVGRPYLADRVDSSFGYYTDYAAFMMVALLVALGSALDAVRRHESGRLVLHATTVLFAGVGLGVSLSRGAALGAAVGVTAMVALSLRSPRRAFALVAALAVSATAIWFAVPSSTRTEFSQRLSQPLGSTGSDQEHLALARIGEHALATHPFGLGYGNFAGYMSSTSGPVSGLTFFHSHRLPVQIGLDAGWLGLAGFVLLVFCPLAGAVRAAGLGRLEPIAAGYAAALVAVLAQGWFDYVFWELSLPIVFSTLVWGTWHSLAGRGER